METLFLNYRRSDAEAHAGRLYDTLSARLPDIHIFMDVDAIEGGEDFVQVLDRTLASTDIMLILIGKSWLSTQDESGSRRLDHPHDFVRLEIATALEREVPLIPVLVQGAMMPAADRLPGPIAALAKRHAVELRHDRWPDDTSRLVDRIETLLAETAPSRLAAARSGSKWHSVRTFGATLIGRLWRFRRRVIRRSSTWRLIKQFAYFIVVVASILVGNAAYQYYVGSAQRTVQRLADQVRYENPQENVVGAILAMRDIVVRSQDTQVANLAVSRLKAVVLANDDTTDKGRAIRKAALEMIKSLRRNDLTRDFADGTLKGADLVGVDLSRTILKNVSFEKGFLIRTDFTAADLSAVDLSSVWIRNADFTAATMTGTNISALDWFNAKGLVASQLRSVDLATLEECPKDASGSYSVDAFRARLSKEYDFPWDTLGQDRTELLAAWSEYSKPGGLCEAVSTWLK